MNSIISKIALLTVALLALIPSLVYAQGGPGFGGGVDDGGGVCVPLDGGLSMLAAAGIGYGVKKYISGRKNQPEAEEIK